MTKKVTHVDILNMGIKTYLRPEDVIKACSKVKGLKLTMRVHSFYFTKSEIQQIKNSLSKDSQVTVKVHRALNDEQLKQAREVFFYE
jgi:hypothetical protein